MTGVRVTVCAILLAGCATRSHRASTDSHDLDGIASWYGPGFAGRATASGETYDPRDMTAAHKTLPFGTRVLVRNLDNDRTVWVRINDRGPFVDGRIIDLSRAAAESIDMVGPGTARVRLRLAAATSDRRDTPVHPRADATTTSWWVQVGAFADRANAEALEARLRADGRRSRLQSTDAYHRVQLGPFTTREAATGAAASLAADGYPTQLIADHDD